MTARDRRLGVLFVTGSALAWSLAGFFTRLITLDVWTMLAWRGLFGALGIAAVILATERGQALRALRRIDAKGWLFAVVSAAGMILFILSLRRTSVAHVAVIYATVPFAAAGLEWAVLRQRPGRSALAASVASLLGVALMVGFGVQGALVGDLLAFGMTLSMAIMMIIARLSRDIPVMPAACLSALMSGLAVWPFGTPLAVSGHDLALLALFGLVNSAAGLTLFTLGARRLPAIETALIGSLDAPLAPAWVWLAFGEVPDKATVAGGLIVFAAVGMHLVVAARRETNRTGDMTAESSQVP